MAKNEHAMTLKEANELTGIAVPTLRKLIEKNQVPGVYFESDLKTFYWIPRKAFMKFLENWDVAESKKALENLTLKIEELEKLIKKG